MRLKQEIKIFINNYFQTNIDDYKLYLYGSRTDDNKKGGDIDLLLLTKEKIDREIMVNFRIGFYKKFGWQKIDLVNFTYNEKHPFKDIILSDAIKIEI